MDQLLQACMIHDIPFPDPADLGTGIIMIRILIFYDGNDDSYVYALCLPH